MSIGKHKSEKTELWKYSRSRTITKPKEWQANFVFQAIFKNCLLYLLRDLICDIGLCFERHFQINILLKFCPFAVK